MRLADMFSRRTRRPRRERPAVQPGVEQLEGRELPAVSAVLADGLLTVTGSAGKDRVDVLLDSSGTQVIVQDYRREVARFAEAAVGGIKIDLKEGNDRARISADLFVPAFLKGGPGKDLLRAGSGINRLRGGPGSDTLVSGSGPDDLDGGAGKDYLQKVSAIDTVAPDPLDVVMAAAGPFPFGPECFELLDEDEVARLLDRAAAATASEDAIIAIVDRNGRPLGVRVEGGVSGDILNNPELLVFAIDGALAKARTAAFFASNQAPLTSRTVQFISQSTITQREVESIPSITDPNSTLRGPGFVALVGIKGHFPPDIPFTPQVDLFLIEHTNRDSIIHPGADHIKGTADDVELDARFNIDPAFVPAGQKLYAPESYGFVSGLQEGAQSRGIATLPGGIPLYENGCLVGGIGVFFPGDTGFATEENSSLSTTFDPRFLDRSLEAEYIAFVAAGGSSGAGFTFGTVGGVPALPGFDLPFGRIDLVGVTLDIYGPGGDKGPANLVRFGLALGEGDAHTGTNVPVKPNGKTLLNGKPVPSGWLVVPHDGDGVSAEEVTRIINQGIVQALQTRAAIRLPLGSRTRMVFAVTDTTGAVLGLFRMPDATVFSIDVAVAKARNVAYYADAGALQTIDQVPGVPPGVAFTNRTFRYVTLPRLPEGIDGQPPGPFSILGDGRVNPANGLNVGNPLPASAYQTVQGYDAFNPGTNFRDPDNILNQNGIVFFPGSSPLYRTGMLIGGFGVSGDGVDQDDVVTFGGALGFATPPTVWRADQAFFRGVRLPYMKFNRNPTG